MCKRGQTESLSFSVSSSTLMQDQAQVLRIIMIIDIDEFYHTKRWHKLRAAVLRRDGYQCQRCKRYGRLRQASTVHHIKHLDEYPELACDPKNLVSLCAACHNEMHPEKGGRRT